MIVLTPDLARRMLDISEQRRSMSAEARAGLPSVLESALSPRHHGPPRNVSFPLRKPKWRHDKGSRS